MAVTYWYWRYFTLEHDEENSLIDALRRAKSDIEWMRAAPDKIVLEDGTELDEKAISEQSGWDTDTDVIIEGTISKGE